MHTIKSVTSTRLDLKRTMGECLKRLQIKNQPSPLPQIYKHRKMEQLWEKAQLWGGCTTIEQTKKNRAYISAVVRDLG